MFLYECSSVSIVVADKSIHGTYLFMRSFSENDYNIVTLSYYIQGIVQMKYNRHRKSK